MNAEDVAPPPRPANMTAAFKKVRGAIGATDPDLADLIVTRIVKLQKLAFAAWKSMSSRTLSSLKVPRIGVGLSDPATPYPTPHPGAISAGASYIQEGA